MNCSYHRGEQHFDTLTKIGKRYLWLQQEAKRSWDSLPKKRLDLSIEGISEEYDITIQREQLNLVSTTREPSATINVSRQRLVLMIDSGAKRKDIPLKRIDRREFPTQLHQHKHDLDVMEYSLDRNERVDIEDIQLSEANRHHHKKLTLNTVRMITHDINQEGL